MVGFKIGTREVGKDAPCFIIAEAGVNHNGKLSLALELVDIAKESGADAVKFQTFKTDSLVLKGAPQAEYQRKNAINIDQYSMLKSLELSGRDFQKISKYCKKKNIIFLSTPFDEESVELLRKIDVPAFKIGSGDLNNIVLLEKILSVKKPLILSTGMSTSGEIREVVTRLEKMGAKEIAILHCVSSYPAPYKEINLRVIPRLIKQYNYPAGFSDHTMGTHIAIAAVALGAKVIEKHFTLDKKMAGPDHKASASPKELKELVKRIREVELALGCSSKTTARSETNTKSVARKSLVSAVRIVKGQNITRMMISAKRPFGGIDPLDLYVLVGKKAKTNIDKDMILKWEMFE
jgi:N,N'-diacetyllegionaminate synthase